VYVLEIVIDYQKKLLDSFINGMYGYCEEINKCVPIEANSIREYHIKMLFIYWF